MLIEYEDLVEQLTRFRLEVIDALAGIDAELDALHKTAVTKQPILPEQLNRLRAKSRERIAKFAEIRSHKIPLLHEKR
jgi:hypothetical protein